MNFSDERYVRLYTRDTITWKAIGWEGRCLLPLLLRKVDRAGVLDMDDQDIEGLAALVDIPADIAERGLAALLKRGVLNARGGALVISKFMEAQECKQSDAQRQRDSRERRRAGIQPVDNVTNRDQTSQPVTDGHSASQLVTLCCAVPSRAQPSQAKEEFAGKASLDPRPVEPVSLSDQPTIKPENLPPRSGPAPSATPRTRASEPEAVEPKQIALLSDADKRTAPPRQKRASDPAPTTVVWLTYSRAYHKRYGVEPVRNAKVNGQLSHLVSQLGAEEAIDVAAFYLTHDGAYYKQQAHEVGLMLRDAQKLRTELRTGRQINDRPNSVPTAKPFDRNDILSQMTRRSS